MFPAVLYIQKVLRKCVLIEREVYKKVKLVSCSGHFRIFSQRGAFGFPEVLSQRALTGVPQPTDARSVLLPPGPSLLLID